MKKVPTSTPDDDRDQRPDQVAAVGDADQADRQRGDLGVAHEPQRARGARPCRAARSAARSRSSGPRGHGPACCLCRCSSGPPRKRAGGRSRTRRCRLRVSVARSVPIRRGARGGAGPCPLEPAAVASQQSDGQGRQRHRRTHGRCTGPAGRRRLRRLRAKRGRGRLGRRPRPSPRRGPHGPLRPRLPRLPCRGGGKGAGATGGRPGVRGGQDRRRGSGPGAGPCPRARGQRGAGLRRPVLGAGRGLRRGPAAGPRRPWPGRAARLPAGVRGAHGVAPTRTARWSSSGRGTSCGRGRRCRWSPGWTTPSPPLPLWGSPPTWPSEYDAPLVVLSTWRAPAKPPWGSA